ncbi:hypothetical protein AAFF_G00262760, partial [Aldrovandia affinis]
DNPFLSKNKPHSSCNAVERKPSVVLCPTGVCELTAAGRARRDSGVRRQALYRPLKIHLHNTQPPLQLLSGISTSSSSALSSSLPLLSLPFHPSHLDRHVWTYPKCLDASALTTLLRLCAQGKKSHLQTTQSSTYKRAARKNEYDLMARRKERSHKATKNTTHCSHRKWIKHKQKCIPNQINFFLSQDACT